MYSLDGVTLQALTIATNDFIPKPAEETLCWRKPAAHRYRFIRQGDIIFVRIDANTTACSLDYGLLDYGVQYAISTEGRILRRLYDGEPEDPSALPPMDMEPRDSKSLVDPSKVGDTSNLPIDCDFVLMMERSTGRKLSTRSEECLMDAGTPQEPSPVDGGTPPP